MPKRKQKHFGLIALLIFSCMLSMPGGRGTGTAAYGGKGNHDGGI